jgi:hypothetical protein
MRAARGFAVALALGGLALACKRNALPPRPDGAAVVVTADATAERRPARAGAGAQRHARHGPETGSRHRARRGRDGQAARGSGKTRDTDLYRLDVPPPDTGGAPPPPPADSGAGAASRRRLLRVEIQPEAASAGRELLDDAGQPLAASGAARRARRSRCPTSPVTPGAYYLRVRAEMPKGSAVTGGGYRLVARLGGALEPGAEVEPNGKAATATELAAPGEAIGYYGWRRDQDWYRVPTAGLADGSVLGADLEPAPGRDGRLSSCSTPSSRSSPRRAGARRSASRCGA